MTNLTKALNCKFKSLSDCEKTGGRGTGEGGGRGEGDYPCSFTIILQLPGSLSILFPKRYSDWLQVIFDQAFHVNYGVTDPKLSMRSAESNRLSNQKLRKNSCLL